MPFIFTCFLICLYLHLHDFFLSVYYIVLKGKFVIAKVYWLLSYSACLDGKVLEKTMA